MALSFREIWWTFYQENILSSGFFRRETASGFYPWGKVDSPRKRVAEGLCGWRHGNSFPMTQSAQSHRQMRSIPLCPKAVFYVFVFDSTHDSGNNAESIPRNVPLNHRNAPTCWGGEIKKRKSGGDFLFFVVETKGFEPLTSAMWLQRSKPAGLRLYFRLAMQSNKKIGDLATYWRFFLSWRGIFSGFS